jgi:hypothetical protein
MPRKSLRNHSYHLDKRMRFRLHLYFLISLILIGVLMFNVLRGTLRVDFGLLGLVAGIGIGIISSRMFHISWSKDAKKVVSRLDTLGIGILILYFLFEILRGTIVGFFTHDIQVATTGFAVLAGIMFGRAIGTRGRIIQILEEQEIFG